jgi:outer membrane protein OmpA-like peptidoglycan-associated protein
MKVRTLLLGAAATLALSSAASADRNGWYIGLEGGWSSISDTSVAASRDLDPVGAPNLGATDAQFDDGWAAFGTVGYGFANHFRLELEVGYRDNDVVLGPFAPVIPGVTTLSGNFNEWSAMANVLYDIPLGQWATFSIGAGAGADNSHIEIDTLSYEDRSWNFAYQGLAGFTFGLSDRLDLTLMYRYLTVQEPDFSARQIPAGSLSLDLDDVTKHTASIGLRYNFGPRAEAAPPPPPPPPPVEAPKAPREFIVFFGHNKSNLTPEAVDVVKQAAAAAKEYGSATITVVGHADKSGSPKYNEGLSMRRASAVKGALVAEGISDGSISTSAKGESDPMVQTDDGVREPQNRRVHITL